MVTDQQVVLLRQRRMEGKTRQTSAAMAGMSVRSARKSQCGVAVGDRARALGGGPGLIPSRVCGKRRSCPCWRARPPAGAGQRQLSNGRRSGTPAASAPRSCAPCNDDYRTGELSTVRSRRSTSPLAEQVDACSTRCVGSSRRRAKPWARFLRSFLGRAGRLALTHDGGSAPSVRYPAASVGLPTLRSGLPEPRLC